jgi:hypothetical protein
MRVDGTFSHKRYGFLALRMNPGDIISFERGQRTTLLSNFSFHLTIVPSVNPILNKQQAHDYFMAHLFFDPPQSRLFCPQNLNILRTKLRASPQEILHFCQIQRIFICEDFEFLLTD